MTTEDRLNSAVRKALKNIAYKNFPFNPSEAAENLDTIERTMKGVIQAMKEVDPLFQDISQRFIFVSSYHEKVSIKKAEEFSLNLLLRLPFQSEDVETCMPEEAPAFVTYRLKRDPTSILEHDRKWTPDLYQKLPDLFDDDLFLMRSKVQEWMQSVIDKAWNGRKFPQMLKRLSETSSTFVISFKKRKLVIDVVPVIEGHQNVPPRGMYKSDRFMQLKQPNQAKGKNRQNIHRKAPHPNMNRGRPHYFYNPRGHDNQYPATLFHADALDSDDFAHRPPPKLQDYVPLNFGGSDDQVEYDPEDDDSRGYDSMGASGDSYGGTNASVRGFRGMSGRGRGGGSNGGEWQIARSRRLPSRNKYSQNGVYGGGGGGGFQGGGGGGFRGGGGGDNATRASGGGSTPSWRPYPPSLPVHSWYLVPKFYKQQNTMFSHEAGDAYWRISFPEAEKRLLQNTGCLTMLIRIFKYLRNQQNWMGLSSYAIKTLFIEEFESLPAGSDYWMETRLGTLFLDMLDVFTQAIRNRHIPHYFNREANLLESLNEQTSENITMYLETMSNEIRENPKLIYKHFGC